MMLFLIKRYMVNNAGEIDILFALMMAAAGIVLAYLVDFVWRKIKKAKDTNP